MAINSRQQNKEATSNSCMGLQEREVLLISKVTNRRQSKYPYHLQSLKIQEWMMKVSKSTQKITKFKQLQPEESHFDTNVTGALDIKDLFSSTKRKFSKLVHSSK